MAWCLRTCDLPVDGDDDVVQRAARCVRHGDEARRLPLHRSASQRRRENGLTMNSTTLIPKCSSTIVCKPTLARARYESMSEYGALTANSTWSCDACISHRAYSLYAFAVTSTSSSFASARKPSTRAASSALRLPPMSTSRTPSSEDDLYSGCSRRRCASARSWAWWSFSGLWRGPMSTFVLWHRCTARTGTGRC